MKRVREPSEGVGTPNPTGPCATSSPDDHGKRSRQQQQQQQRRPQHDLAEINSNHLASSSKASTEHLGPFRALLAVHGVAWPEAPVHAGAAGVEGGEEEGRLGFPCRCNPPKLRLGVEKALVHDRARRREFVEVMLFLRKKAPVIFPLYFQVYTSYVSVETWLRQRAA